MTAELTALVATAASLGLVHTLIGPDHYIPFIAMSRARHWSRGKTLLITLLCGIGHVGSSIVIGLAGVGLGVAVAKLEAVPQGGGLYRVKAEVENAGFWPTAMAHAVVARAVRPTMAQLQVPPESILSGNQKTSFIQSLAGSGDRHKLDWLIKAKPGETLTLKVVSQKAGADAKSVVLK